MYNCIDYKCPVIDRILSKAPKIQITVHDDDINDYVKKGELLLLLSMKTLYGHQNSLIRRHFFQLSQVSGGIWDVPNIRDRRAFPKCHGHRH